MFWKTGKIVPVKEDEKEEEKKVTKFRVIEGGQKTGAKEPPETDWLTRLTKGTTFLTTPKTSVEPFCAQVSVINHGESEDGESIVKINQEGHEGWVLALRFCQRMKLVAILERGI